MLAILAAVMLAAAPGTDTVYTANGGRLVGTVVEESPQGVSVQLADGTTRRLARNEVSRIEYADGSVSTPNRAPPPAQPPQYRAPPAPPPSYAQPPPPSYRPPPPPAYRPPQPPPAYPAYPAQQAAQRNTGPMSPLWLSFGIGGSFPGGDAAAGVPMRDVFDSQLGVLIDGGVRLNPHLGLGLYLDLGYGDPASNWRAYCETTYQTSCSANTGRFGIQLRHTFDPYAASTPWISVGTGYEWGGITADYAGSGNYEVATYHGWEILRLMGGIDLRTSPVFGVGLYGGVSFGQYSSYNEPDAGYFDQSLSGQQKIHSTIEAGLKFTLFP
jgi:hypothetical protein